MGLQEIDPVQFHLEVAPIGGRMLESIRDGELVRVESRFECISSPQDVGICGEETEVRSLVEYYEAGSLAVLKYGQIVKGVSEM